MREVGVTCDVIRDLGALSALSDPWRELLRDTEHPEPVHSPSWLLTWWRVFGDSGGRRLNVLVFREPSGRLMGILPLLRRTVISRRRPLPIRRLELLASGEDEAHETCSEYIGAIVRRGADGAVATSAASALLDAPVDPWDQLSMVNMREDDPFIPALQHAFADRGVASDVQVTNVAYYTFLPSTWEAYLQSLTSSHRYAVRRANRDFEQWQGTRERQVHAATEGPALQRALRILRDLHNERWGDGAGAFRSPLFTRFHEQLCERLTSSGDALAEVLWMTVGGEPVSALYNFVLDGRVRYYQAGRRTDLPKRIRPGIVLHTVALQRAIERGWREYDFLATHRQYKAQLAPHRRALVSLRCVAPTHRARELHRSLRWLDRTEANLRALRNAARATHG